MTLPSLFKENRIFFIGYFLLLFIGIFVWGFYSRADGFILLNPFHSSFLNVLFIGITTIGDGIFTVALCIILFFFKRRFLSLMILSSFLISGIISQVIKYFFLEARPAMFFEKTNYPYFIDHVTLHNFHSFPSGHATSAFAMVSILCFSIKNKNYSVLLLMLGALVGCSRIYLGQHFINDISAGSIIGVLFSIFSWIYFEKYFKRILKIESN